MAGQVAAYVGRSERLTARQHGLDCGPRRSRIRDVRGQAAGPVVAACAAWSHSLPVLSEEGLHRKGALTTCKGRSTEFAGPDEAMCRPRGRRTENELAVYRLAKALARSLLAHP